MIRLGMDPRKQETTREETETLKRKKKEDLSVTAAVTMAGIKKKQVEMR